MAERGQEVVIARLGTIIKLLAMSVAEGKTQTEKIRILSAAGLAPKEIAEILGTTPNTVRVALSGLRKRIKKASPKEVAEET